MTMIIKFLPRDSGIAKPAAYLAQSCRNFFEAVRYLRNLASQEVCVSKREHGFTSSWATAAKIAYEVKWGNKFGRECFWNRAA
jgi:hypothetical protein